MRLPIRGWTETLRNLRLKIVERSPSSIRKRSQTRRSPFESLELRRMMATDISIDSFTSNSSQLVVNYSVGTEAASEFDVNVYRSSDGIALDALVGTTRVTDSGDLAVGNGHSATITADFTDVESDYVLIAVVDASSENSESNEANNKANFGGGIFQAADGVVHVHGTSGADTVTVSQTTTLNIIYNGGSAVSFPGSGTSAATAMHVRMGSGADTVTADSSVQKDLWLLGGSGNDVLTGGERDDFLGGGAGNDTLTGGSGNDTYIFSGTAAGMGTDTIVESSGGGTDALDFSGYIDSYDEGVNFNLLYGYVHDNFTLATLATFVSSADFLENAIGSVYSDSFLGNSSNNVLTGGAGDDFYWFDGVGDLGTDTIVEAAAGGSDGIDLWNVGLAAGTGVTFDLSSTSSAYQVINHSVMSLTLNLSSAELENLYGTQYDDVLLGNARNNYLSGRAGNDTYQFVGTTDQGTDMISEVGANGGNDTLDFSGLNLGAGVNVDLAGGMQQVVNHNGEQLTLNLQTHSGGGFENVIGTQHSDTLSGNSANNTLQGGSGNDMYKFMGTSSLGTDTVVEASSGGSDTLDFSGVSFGAGVILNLASTNSSYQVINTSDKSLYLNLSGSPELENLIGTPYADTLTGNSLGNTLTGGAGDDTLTGGTGGDTYVFSGSSNLGSDTIIEAANAMDDTIDLSGLGSGATLNLASTAQQTIASSLLALTLSSATGVEKIIGSAYNDTLTGNTRNNAFTGNAGNDSLNGGSGSDLYIFSGSLDLGSDTITEAANSDNYDGLIFSHFGFGINVDLAQTSAQTISAGKLVITLSSATGIEAASGSSYDDTILGNARSNHLFGAQGNDLLYGFSGSDTIDGGSDHDEIYGGDDSDYLFDGAGNDLVYGEDGDDNLNYDPFRVEVNESEGDDLFFGGEGDDHLAGGMGNDTLEGDEGNDFYLFTDWWAGGNHHTIVEAADDGIDTVEFWFVDGITLNSGVTNEQTVSPGYLTLSLSNAAGLENVHGGDGNDTLIGNAHNNTLAGGAGNDTLFGGDGNDALIGSNGDDTLVGDAGNDTLTGGDDDDLYLFNPISGPLGSDSIVEDANSDADTLDLRNFTDGLILDLALTSSQTVVSSLLTLALSTNTSIEDVLGGGGNDSIAGNSRDNRLTGNRGDDTLIGFGGADRLFGGVGDDDLQGRDGADAIFGGIGDDDLYGGLGDDFLYGESGDDILDDWDAISSTEGGSDHLDGGGGADELNGRSGADILNGGNSEADLLNNGPDDDHLIGGTGDDTYVFEWKLGDFSLGGDVITEAASAGNDLVDFSSFFADGYDDPDTAAGGSQVVVDDILSVTFGTTSTVEYVDDPGVFGSAVTGIIVDPFSNPDSLTLTASTIGTLDTVEFYWDTNANGQYDFGIDQWLGEDIDDGNGWSIELEYDAAAGGYVVDTGVATIIVAIPPGPTGFLASPLDGLITGMVGAVFFPTVIPIPTEGVFGTPTFVRAPDDPNDNLADDPNTTALRATADVFVASGFSSQSDSGILTDSDRFLAGNQANSGFLHLQMGGNSAEGMAAGAVLTTSTISDQPGIGVSGIINAATNASAVHQSHFPFYPELNLSEESDCWVDFSATADNGPAGQSWTLVDPAAPNQPSNSFVLVSGQLSIMWGGIHDEIDYHAGYADYRVHTGASFDVTAGNSQVMSIAVADGSVSAYTILGTPVVWHDQNPDNYAVSVNFHFVMPINAVLNVKYGAYVDLSTFAGAILSDQTTYNSGILTYVLQMNVEEYWIEP